MEHCYYDSSEQQWIAATVAVAVAAVVITTIVIVIIINNRFIMIVGLLVTWLVCFESFVWYGMTVCSLFNSLPITEAFKQSKQMEQCL